MYTTLRYILITAIRDWLFIGLFVAIGLAAAGSFFLGGTALVEEMQMTIAFISGSSRVIIVTGFIVFVCFHVRRAFDNREVEVILTRPISRTTFIFAYWLGFAVLSLIVTLPTIGMIWAMLKVDLGGLIFWGSSLVLEVFLVVAFALACSLILKSAVTSVLVSFGFYVISRMMGFFTMMSSSPLFPDSGFNWWMHKAIDGTAMLLPRMDLFSKSKWLIYGVESDAAIWVWNFIPVFVPQAVVYTLLLLFMARFDFIRRQF